MLKAGSEYFMPFQIQSCTPVTSNIVLCYYLLEIDSHNGTVKTTIGIENDKNLLKILTE